MMTMILPLLILIGANSWYLSLATLPIILLINIVHLGNCTSSYMSFHHFTIDTLSIYMILLSVWVTILLLLSSMKIMSNNLLKEKFHTTVLVLLLMLILSFSATNLFTFYIFFEASLIPTLYLILTWGYQPERLQSGMYMMLYTMSMSLPLLATIMYMRYQTSSTSMFIIMKPMEMMLILKMGMSLAFLVKLPIYGLHLWLPKAHVEAPVAGSMILAGVLLKLGGYGLMRISMIQPQLIFNCSIVMSLSLWGGLLTSIMCIRQLDMKSMIAYSSVSHMALVIAGILSNSVWGWTGAIMMMIAHGLASSGLFSLANMYYENTNTRSLFIMKGMMIINPMMSLWWMMMTVANMAGPPTINLLSEILLLTSSLFYSHWTLPILMLLSFFTVVYSLVLFTSLHHGPPSEHLNYFKPLPLYHTISFLHLAPLFLLITCPMMITFY